MVIFRTSVTLSKTNFISLKSGWHGLSELLYHYCQICFPKKLFAVKEGHRGKTAKMKIGHKNCNFCFKVILMVLNDELMNYLTAVQISALQNALFKSYSIFQFSGFRPPPPSRVSVTPHISGTESRWRKKFCRSCFLTKTSI